MLADPYGQPPRLVGLKRAPQALLRLVVLLTLALGLAMLLAPLAQAQEEPTLLVAAEELQGPYAGTVILATPYGESHLGVILNRPLQVKLGELFPEHEPSKRVTRPLHFGGPEVPQGLFALVRESVHPYDIELMPGLWLVTNGKAVDNVIEAQGDAARYFAGFVGWRPGELEEELRKGYFVKAPADADKAMRPDTSQLHEELVPKKGRVGI